MTLDLCRTISHSSFRIMLRRVGAVIKYPTFRLRQAIQAVIFRVVSEAFRSSKVLRRAAVAEDGAMHAASVSSGAQTYRA